MKQKDIPNLALVSGRSEALCIETTQIVQFQNKHR